MDPGSPLPTIKEQGLNPAGLPATANDLGLPATAHDLGPVLPDPGSIAMLIWRAEMRTGRLGELKWGAVTPAPQNPAYFTEARSKRGPCSSRCLEDDPSFPGRPRRIALPSSLY